MNGAEDVDDDMRAPVPVSARVIFLTTKISCFSVPLASPRAPCSPTATFFFFHFDAEPAGCSFSTAGRCGEVGKARKCKHFCFSGCSSNLFIFLSLRFPPQVNTALIPCHGDVTPRSLVRLRRGPRQREAAFPPHLFGPRFRHLEDDSDPTNATASRSPRRSWGVKQTEVGSGPTPSSQIAFVAPKPKTLFAIPFQIRRSRIRKSRTPVQWDWETLGLFNGEEAELSNPSKDRKSKRESGIAIDTDYAYSMGMAVCSSSEVGYCSFQSSNAASADSSKAKKRIPEINRSVEGLLHNHRVVKSKTSDPCIGTGIKNSTSSSHIISSTMFAKSSRVCEKSTLIPYCQVEGCNIDLATAKDYHRKHKVCEEHAKSPKVTVGGQECRFCQQCSRFHALSEFDQQKRSCRKRLFYHNARRRKPQLGATSFSSPTPPASIYDDGQQANLMLVQAPFSQTTTRAGSIRDHSSSLPHTQAGESPMKSSKTKGVQRQLSLPSGGLLFSDSAVSHDIGWLLRHGVAAVEVLDQGLEPNITFLADGAPDVQSACSLLSTKSHTPNRGTTSNAQFAYANKSNDAARLTLHTFNQTKGLATTPLFGSESDGHSSSKTSFGMGLFDSSQPS